MPVQRSLQGMLIPSQRPAMLRNPQNFSTSFIPLIASFPSPLLQLKTLGTKMMIQPGRCTAKTDPTGIRRFNSYRSKPIEATDKFKL